MGNQQAGCSGIRARKWETDRSGPRGFDGKYRPVRILGSGQFSTVYECVRTDNPTERYAMKVMSCWTWDSRTLRRIEEEISIMQDLGRSHPCVVRLVESYKERACLPSSQDTKYPETFPFDALHVSPVSGTHGVSVAGPDPSVRPSQPSIRSFEQNPHGEDSRRGRCMWRIGLVLDFCGGGDLADYLNRHGALEENKARHVIYKLCHGLAFLHSHGIIHRDIKPENILIEKDDGNSLSIKISDFGLAKKMTERLHRSSSLCGSDFYLPPEMLQRRPYDTQVDMWSVGVLSFAVLFGFSAFSSMEMTTLYQQIVERKLSVLPSSQKSQVSAGAWKFLLDMLQVQPELRLTAFQALRHRWLRGSLSEDELRGLPALTIDKSCHRELQNSEDRTDSHADPPSPYRSTNLTHRRLPNFAAVEVCPFRAPSTSHYDTRGQHSISGHTPTMTSSHSVLSGRGCTDQTPAAPFRLPGTAVASTKTALVDLGIPTGCTSDTKRPLILGC